MNPHHDSFSEKERQAAKLKALFGVSEEELVRRGINPDEYARRNIRRVLKDKHKQEQVLSRSMQLKLRWTQYGWWGFMCLFATAGCLFVTKVPSLWWPAFGGACACFAVALYFGMLFYRYRFLWKRACRDEGIKATLRRRRGN